MIAALMSIRKLNTKLHNQTSSLEPQLRHLIALRLWASYCLSFLYLSFPICKIGRIIINTQLISLVCILVSGIEGILVTFNCIMF